MTMRCMVEAEVVVVVVVVVVTHRDCSDDNQKSNDGAYSNNKNKIPNTQKE